MDSFLKSPVVIDNVVVLQIRAVD